MSDVHLKFLFEGLPVRGVAVRLGPSWREVLARRRSAHDGGHPWPAPVRALLGEMAAAGLLLHGNLKFDGALVLQLQGGAGPLALAVAEVQPDLAFRVSAKLRAAAAVTPADAGFGHWVDGGGLGRCAVTLDPQGRLPGQQPYQGVVPLSDAHGRPLADLAEALTHYMRQSEQLETRLHLAADDEHAAGLLLQRLPLAGGMAGVLPQDEADEAFERLSMLAATVTADELRGLAPQAVLQRLFWQEPLRHFEPRAPRFACRCSRERVAAMLRSLGQEEVMGLVAERGLAEVGCEFCGAVQRFDAVDAQALFTDAGLQPGVGPLVQ